MNDNSNTAGESGAVNNHSLDTGAGGVDATRNDALNE